MQVLTGSKYGLLYLGLRLMTEGLKAWVISWNTQITGFKTGGVRLYCFKLNPTEAGNGYYSRRMWFWRNLSSGYKGSSENIPGSIKGNVYICGFSSWWQKNVLEDSKY